MIAKFIKDVLKIKNEKLIEEACKVAEVRHAKKGECLISKGTKPIYIMFKFLEEGVTRGYFYNEEGKEITDCIQYEVGTPIMPDNNFLIPAPISMEALTDCAVLCIPIENILRFQKKYFKEITLLELRLINDSWNLHLELKRVNCQYTAMQRYQWFLDKYPNLIDEINNKYIASFLNMTPVTLSRLRRELKENNVDE